jgi:hypothetical protein
MEEGWVILSDIEENENGWKILRDEEHKIQGVTPDMIDWWFDNMEKGYAMWHPSDHKGFRWEISPAQVGHVGALQLATQRPGAKPDEPLQEMRIRYDDVSLCPVHITFEHVLVTSARYDSDGKPVHMAIHQYEAASYGTHHRFTAVTRESNAVMETPSKPTHSELEAARWSEFLPQLYKMWQAVIDPEINVPCCLKVKRLPDGKFVYISRNKPATK